MRIKSIYSSKELLEILEEKEYKIHSVYKSGFNILVDNQLCFIGNKRNMLLPYGILISVIDIQAMLTKIDPNTTTFRWEKESKSFGAKEISIYCNESIIFTSKMSEGEVLNKKEQLKSNSKYINMEWDTGFDKKIKELRICENAEIRSLYNEVQGDALNQYEMLKKFVGKGRGLTPAGDDFLIGLLWVNQINPFATKEFILELERLFKNKQTTVVSVHYYMAAYKKLYNGALLNLEKGLILGREEILQESVEQLRTMGDTSGIDLLAGITTTIDFLVEDKNL